MDLYLGIDFGTSGARAVVIDIAGNVQAEALQQFRVDTQAALWIQMWQETLFNLIEQIPKSVRQKIRAIAINGTSSTVLLCDERGTPVSEPLLYNDGRGVEVLETVKAIAPTNSTVISATSSLVKLLWMSK